MAEEILRITGGVPLRGEITVQGAKNSALPDGGFAALYR